jgi:Flp pilus assembly protein TadD
MEKALEVKAMHRLFVVNVALSSVLLGGCGRKQMSPQIANLTRAVEQNPEDPKVYLARGMALHEAGDFDGALRDFDTHLRLDPNSSMGYARRGITLCAKESYEGAMQSFWLAIQLDPENHVAFNGRRMVCQRRPRSGDQRLHKGH